MPMTRKKRVKKKATSKQSTLGMSAAAMADELQKAGEGLSEEVKQTFELLGERVSGVARYVMNQASSATGRISTSEIARFHELMEEIKDTGEHSLNAIGENFDFLRQQIADMIKTSGVKTRKKRTSKKKTGKKKSSKKKATKKKMTKKKASRKKISKKTLSKKKGSKKKSTKKTPTRKKVTKRRVSKKKIVPVATGTP